MPCRIIVQMMPNKNEVTNMDVIDSFLARFPCRSDGGKRFVINRNPQGLPWLNRDSFKIPSSVCNCTGTSNDCETFEALNYSRYQSCSCYCPSQNSSLVFHNNKWKCLDNSQVRELQGKRIIVVV